MSELTEENTTNYNKASPISSSFAKRIVDFSFIEKLLECPLCLEQYDGLKFIPRILPCNIATFITNMQNSKKNQLSLFFMKVATPIAKYA
jgi:hypothetical protein